MLLPLLLISHYRPKIDLFRSVHVCDSVTTEVSWSTLFGVVPLKAYKLIGNGQTAFQMKECVLGIMAYSRLGSSQSKGQITSLTLAMR